MICILDFHGTEELLEDDDDDDLFYDESFEDDAKLFVSIIV